VRRRAALALAVLVVVICAWPLVVFDMRHYLPQIDNDEIMYFLLVKNFLSQGFHAGYSFVNDQIPATAIHFDIHGPGTVLLYGQLARVVGWTNYSPYLANLVLFVSAWSLLVYVLRRSPVQQIAAALFVLTQGYFFIFLPSAMQESFHISMAVAVAALWHEGLARRSAAAWLGVAALLIVATVVRYSWATVIPVVAYSFCTQWTSRNPRQMAWRTVFGLVLSAVTAALIGYAAIRVINATALPPYSIDGSLSFPLLSQFDGARVEANLSRLFHLRLFRMFADYPKFFLVAYLVSLALTFAVAAGAGHAARRVRRAAAFSAWILAFSIVAQVLLYAVDGYREFRVLAPAHAVAGLIVLPYLARTWPRRTASTRMIAAACLIAVVIANAAFTAEAVETVYDGNWRQLTTANDISGRLQFARLAPYFAGDDTESAFCKTVYASGDVISDARLIHLPARLSLSLVIQNENGELPPLKGKYVLARSVHPAPPRFDWRAALTSSPAWRLVAESDDFALFRSTTQCGAGAAERSS
jgi:hypothetical protein